MPLEKLPLSMIEGSLQAADVAARYDVMLLAFRNQMLSGRVFEGMVQGMSDAFEDQSGIDAPIVVYSGDVANREEPGGYTIFDRGVALPVGMRIETFEVFLETANEASVKIGLENSASDIDVVLSEAISHSGSGWETFTLSVPFIVPATGTYRLGCYTPNVRSTSATNGPGSYITGEAIGDTESYSTSATMGVIPLKAVQLGLPSILIYDEEANAFATSTVLVTPSSGTTWSAPAGHLASISGDDVQTSGAGCFYWTAPIEGDFDTQFRAKAEIGNTQYFGVFEADALDIANFGGPQPVSHASGYYFNYVYYNHVYFNMVSTPETIGGSTGGNNTYTVKLSRRGDTYTWYQNGSIKGTFTGHYTGPVLMHTGYDGGGFWVYDVSVTTYPTTNLDIVSIPQEADFAPTAAQIALWEEDAGDVTLNEDIRAYASSDDGATWDEITLTEKADLNGGRLLGGTVELTGGGTEMRWRVTTHNDADVKLHAAGMLWG